MIGVMVTDLLEETRRRIEATQPKGADDIRRLDRPVAAFSKAMAANDAALKAFLFDHMYRHYKLNRMTSKARRVVRDLFGLLTNERNACRPNGGQGGGSQHRGHRQTGGRTTSPA